MPRVSFGVAFVLAALGCKKDSIVDSGQLDASLESPPVDAARASDGAILGEPDAPTGDPACAEAANHSDFTWIQDNVLTPSCATGPCHDAIEPDVDLDLSAGAAHGNLVNKGASTQSGWIRVVPGSPDDSYLVVALGRAPGPMPRDGFMPLNMPPLCEAKLEAVERWILAGAPND